MIVTWLANLEWRAPLTLNAILRQVAQLGHSCGGRAMGESITFGHLSQQVAGRVSSSSLPNMI